LRLLRRPGQALHLLLRDRHKVPGVPFFGTSLSGPLLDRSDIHIEVPRVEYEKLYLLSRSLTSAWLCVRSSPNKSASTSRDCARRVLAR
jgi:hypothetical protein